MSTSVTARPATHNVLPMGNRMDDKIGGLRKPKHKKKIRTEEEIAAERKKVLRNRAIKSLCVVGLMAYAVYSSSFVRYQNIGECISIKSSEFARKGVSPPYERALTYCKAEVDKKG
jgi:hypothetical protein